MTFQAAVWADTGTQLEELKLHSLRPHEVQVRIEASNVGSADAFTLLDHPSPPGLPPLLPALQIHGHAAVATIEALGAAVERLAVGDRVLVTSSANCGTCLFCQRGRFDQCAENIMFGPPTAHTADGADVYPNSYIGSFAELAITRDIQLTPIRSDLPVDQLALISNPVATGVGAALRTAPVQPGSVVAVLGCGPVGLSYIMGARLSHAEQIIAIDPLPHRRKAASRLGATTVIDPAAVDPVATVCELSGDAGGSLQGRGADYSFEATSDVDAVQQAWAMTRSTGHVVLSGLDPSAATVSLPAAFAIVGKTIHGCQQGSLLMRRDLPWLVRLAERGQLELTVLTERDYALADTEQALRDVADCAVLGATLLPTS